MEGLAIRIREGNWAILHQYETWPCQRVQLVKHLKQYERELYEQLRCEGGYQWGGNWDVRHSLLRRVRDGLLRVINADNSEAVEGSVAWLDVMLMENINTGLEGETRSRDTTISSAGHAEEGPEEYTAEHSGRQCIRARVPKAEGTPTATGLSRHDQPGRQFHGHPCQACCPPAEDLWNRICLRLRLFWYTHIQPIVMGARW